MHRIVGTSPLDGTDFSGPDACEMYANAVRSARFEARAATLTERGWLAGYRPLGGLVATGVGAAFAAGASTPTFPDRRSTPLLLSRGVPVADLLASLRGHPVESDEAPVPPLGAPGGNLPLAVGAGMAVERTDESDAVLACLDAATTAEGDFHEACNFAGVFESPCVFLCVNDGATRIAASTVAETATAYGFDGVRVDGTDPLAVADVVNSALDDARESGPVLVEAVSDGGGDAADAVDRFETYLREEDALDGTFATEAREAAEAELDRAVEAAEGRTADATDLFEHVFAEKPPELRAQRAAMRRGGADSAESD